MVYVLMVRDAIPVAIDAFTGTVINPALVRANVDEGLVSLGHVPEAAPAAIGPPNAEQIHDWATSPEAKAGQQAALAMMQRRPV